MASVVSASWASDELFPLARAGLAEEPPPSVVLPAVAPVVELLDVISLELALAESFIGLAAK